MRAGENFAWFVVDTQPRAWWRRLLCRVFGHAEWQQGRCEASGVRFDTMECVRCGDGWAAPAPGEVEKRWAAS